ncbi:IS66 family transposase ISCARN22 [subsurface metagenome]
MNVSDRQGVMQCGRKISGEEVEQIRQTLELLPGLAVNELAATICEHLEWHTAGGGLKVDACLKLLNKLETEGVLELTERQKAPRRKSYTRNDEIAITGRTDPGSRVEGTVRNLEDVRLEVVVELEEKKLWNEYVQRYHPLGYKNPFGYRLRYFITCRQGRLGCLLFSGAAKSLGARDGWIGWSEQQRLRNLAWVINLSRHLIFPWVEVKNLSSHVLGKVARGIADDWQKRWRYRPVLMETFVDPRHREGSCYKAAGWQYIGMTTGKGLVREGGSYNTSPKKIFMKPLLEEFSKLLCSEQLVGRVDV